MGLTTATHLANYSTLVEVVSSALGGGKDQEGTVEDLREAPPEVMQARVAQLLGR